MINLAQIGIGYWESNLLRVFNDLDGGRLRVACDSRLDKYQELVKRYRDILFVTDYRSLLNDPAIDAVVILPPRPRRTTRLPKSFCTW